MPKRSTETQMNYTERRVKVAQDYLKGDYQTEIAERYGVSQTTISNDLKAIRLEWQIQYAETFDSIVAEQLVKIDKTEREAWQAWERSKEDQRVEETVEGADGSKYVDVTKVETMNRDGDPRFLQIVQRCIDTRLKVVGGYAKDRLDERRLSNEEKWVTELVEYLKAGKVTPEEVRALFPDLADQFFARAGITDEV